MICGAEHVCNSREEADEAVAKWKRRRALDVEAEREACAAIAEELQAEFSERSEKLKYGWTQTEVCAYIAEQIRARGKNERANME
jgi:sRNA-binding protein